MVRLRNHGADQWGNPQEHHLSGARWNLGVVGGVGAHYSRTFRQPGCHGYSDPSLPSLRDRPPYQPHPRLRIAHGNAGRCVSRCGGAPTVRLSDAYWGRVADCDSGIHAGHRGPFRSAKTPHPVVDRSQLLPQGLRRGQDSRAFSAKLREETDLEALNHDLLEVIGETMRPKHFSLWLRPETPPKGKQTD